jgi:adenosylcobinamide-GDP ribazoletransferase
MNQWLDDLRIATAFLTRLPMPHPDGAQPESFARAQRLFPLVGAGIGAAVGLFCLLLRAIGVPDLAAAALALGGAALLTGALHEDGLADVADGFGGGRDVAAKLEIMRDSRLGTYGALALVVSFAAKLAAIAAIPDGLVVQSLIAAHALGRGVLPWIAISLPYARKDGLAANAGRPRRHDRRSRGRHRARDRCAGPAARQRAAGGDRGRRERSDHDAIGKAADRRPDRRCARRRRAGRGERDPGAARGAIGVIEEWTAKRISG